MRLCGCECAYSESDFNRDGQSNGESESKEAKISERLKAKSAAAVRSWQRSIKRENG